MGYIAVLNPSSEDWMDIAALAGILEVSGFVAMDGSGALEDGHQ